MPVRKLKEFLDQNGVRYVSISHSPAFTAQEIAASAHVSGRELAKSVVVKLDGKLALAVVPATRRVDFGALARLSGAREIELASEGEFAESFPGCETGAMPPFGNLYGLEVYADEGLAQQRHIAFNAGSHTELMRLEWRDFERLVRPKMGSIAQPA